MHGVDVDLVDSGDVTHIPAAAAAGMRMMMMMMMTSDYLRSVSI